ncbi:MAG: hypothetical protein K1X29_10325 [Bdellovibrionales bacterium]|nr:hypothetical protein [Bdellovibrionales bacterium]
MRSIIYSFGSLGFLMVAASSFIWVPAIALASPLIALFWVVSRIWIWWDSSYQVVLKPLVKMESDLMCSLPTPVNKAAVPEDLPLQYGT